MIHSFLLIGQSNMAGRGFLNEAKEIDKTHIKVLRNGLWVPMFRPVNPDRAFSGVNLAESFAEGYAKAHGVDVGLICCADGGTKLSQWMPGETLYENAVNNARLALRCSTLVGILWHQGESDIKSGIDNYRPRFEEMIASLKKDIGCGDVPVIVGALGEYLKDYAGFTEEDFSEVLRFNKTLEQMAADNKNMAYVSSRGLKPNPDNLHFSAEALYDFGLRYLDAFELLDYKPDTASDPAAASRTAIELLQRRNEITYWDCYFEISEVFTTKSA